MPRITVLSLLAVIGLLPSAASAQYGRPMTAQHANYQQMAAMSHRLEAMEVELASYRSGSMQQASYGSSCDSCGGGCGGCTSCCNDCCPTNFHNDYGWYVGLEAVYAKPHFADGIESGDPAYDYELTPRIVAGFKNDCGLGVRARYWYFDDESSAADGTGSANTGDRHELQMDVIDLELTKDLNWGCVSAIVFGGVRYAEIDHGQVFGGTDRTQVEGIGPTLGFETKAPVLCNGAFVFNLRYSALFGDGVATDNVNPGIDDVGFGSLESQLGVQWQRDIGCGTARISGLVEAQQWMQVTRSPANVGDSPDEDMLILGFVLGFEYLR